MTNNLSKAVTPTASQSVIVIALALETVFGYPLILKKLIGTAIALIGVGLLSF